MQSVATNLKPILEQELAALQRMASALLGENEALKQQDQEGVGLDYTERILIIFNYTEHLPD